VLSPLKKQITEIIECDFGIIDKTGTILIAKTISKEKTILKEFNQIANSDLLTNKLGSFIYQKIKPQRNKEFYVYINDNIENSKTVLKLIALLANNYIKTYYEKHDKQFFLKQILKEEVTDMELSKKADIYKLKNDVSRVVMLVKALDSSEVAISEIIINMFADSKKNFIIELDNCDVVVIVETNNTSEQDIVDMASSIIATIEEELLIPVIVGIGSKVNNLKDITKSYNKASIACDIGGVFESEKNIFTYSKLGIGLLINEVSKEHLQMFLEQIVDIDTFSNLDDEIIKTIQQFFENSLNISETARKMYLHRNTLVYRIEKVQKQTGLDVRNFEEAILFKAAHMVKSYLEKLNDNT